MVFLNELNHVPANRISRVTHRHVVIQAFRTSVPYLHIFVILAGLMALFRVQHSA
jgi:hypothetical protein